MADIRRPNDSIREGSRGGSYPTATHAGTIVNGPNNTHPGDRRGGTAPLGGSGDRINPPNSTAGAPIGHSSDR